MIIAFYIPDELAEPYRKERFQPTLAKLESVQATAYTESVDAGMRERKLKRALYKACANWANSEQYIEATWYGDENREELWSNVKAKCQAKAEE